MPHFWRHFHISQNFSIFGRQWLVMIYYAWNCSQSDIEWIMIIIKKISSKTILRAFKNYCTCDYTGNPKTASSLRTVSLDFMIVSFVPSWISFLPNLRSGVPSSPSLYLGRQELFLHQFFSACTRETCYLFANRQMEQLRPFKAWLL